MTSYHRIALYTCCLVEEIKALEKGVLSEFITNSDHSYLHLFLFFIVLGIIKEAELHIRFVCKVGERNAYLAYAVSDLYLIYIQVIKCCLYLPYGA